MIAYFSMEIGVDPRVPSYSGGLGMLAGDSVRAAADMGLPFVAVTLLHRAGYFQQRLDDTGWQQESAVAWNPADKLEELPARAVVEICGRPVVLRAWKYEVTGGTHGEEIPVFFLDADLPENTPEDRALTGQLYGGDWSYRLRQEAILGIGGVRMLDALTPYLKLAPVTRYHMNEGHASLLVAEILRRRLVETGRTPGPDVIRADDIEFVRSKCVFTTHTPIPAGHDRFGMDTVREVLGPGTVLERADLFQHEGLYNTTYAALNLSRYVNGVAKTHGEVSRRMFPNYDVDSITNGVHLSTWVSAPMAELLDARVPGWRTDNASLRSVLGIPTRDLRQAHDQAKRALIEFVNAQAGGQTGGQTAAGFSESAFTIGFARRATGYKRPDLLLADPDRLARISRDAGPLQVIYAGKAHPKDHHGKEIIQKILRLIPTLRDHVKLVYLPEYDFDLCKRMVGGVDLWLNTPQPPLEASGTSGMKAAANGVPQLSTLDGWWVEGCVPGVTGWPIGEATLDDDPGRWSRDAESLYTTLEREILPTFYGRAGDAEAWGRVMRSCIAINASFFTTHRMMQQYVVKAYFG
ncbi:MAG: alpha-glucan family phosphorylase [Planctomycetota bacterium]|nr:alpha-glucan family phosphorylase [Planctomycetota bacterium]